MNKVIAPAVSALTPSNEVTFVILVPIVLIIFQPPLIVPNAMAIKKPKVPRYNAVQSSQNVQQKEYSNMYILKHIYVIKITAAPIIPITF
jgi:hypothetical protein